MTKRKAPMLTVEKVRDYIESIGAERPSHATVCRWCSKGVHGMFLPHVRVGKIIFVNRTDVDKFLSRLGKERA